MAKAQSSTEGKLRHLNAILRAIRNVNQLIASENNPSLLIKRSCKLLIENDGFKNAWIVLYDENGDFVEAAQAGVGKKFSLLKKHLKEGKTEKCLADAIVSDSVVQIADPSKTCPECPLHDFDDGRSGASMRLQYDERLYGVLSVSVHHDYIGDPDEIELLKEVADDLAYALHNLDLEVARKQVERALLLTQFSVDRASDAVYWSGRDARFLYANDAAIRMLDYDLKELMKMTVHDIDPSFPKKVWRNHWLELKQKNSMVFESTHVTKDGRKVPVEVAINYIEFDGKEYNIAICRDIGERNRAEAAIQKNEKLFRLLADNANDMIYRMSLPDGRYEYVSPASKILFGYEPEKFYDSPLLIQNIIHPHWHTYFEIEWQNLLAGNMSPTYEYKIVHKSGDIRWIHQRNYLVKNENNEPIAIEGMAMDVTEGKNAREALEESKRTLSTLLGNLPGMAYRCINKEDWEMLFVSEGSRTLTGYKPDELVGNRVVDYGSIVHPLDREYVWEKVQKSLRLKNHFEIEYKIIARNGEEKWVWERGVNVADDIEGKSVIEGFIIDVTDRKNAETAIKENERLYSGLVNTINSGVAIYKVLNDGRSGNDYIIKEFNKFALKHEGMKKSDVVGKSLLQLRPKIDEYGLIPIFRKVWKTGKPAYFPANVYVDENFSNYYENRIFRLPSGEIVAIFDDVTGRALAEVSMKKSDERFKLAMQATNDGLYDWDLITNEIYFSPGWKQMLGYEENELENDFSIWEQLTKPEDIEKSWTMLNEHFQGKRERFELEFQMHHKDGRWIDIFSRANAIFDNEGKAVRVVGTHVDVTERKRAEQLVRESEEKFRALFHASPDILAIQNFDGQVLEVNDTAQKRLGYSREEMQSMIIFDYQEKYSNDDLMSINRELEKTGNALFESVLIGKDDEHIPVEISASLIDFQGQKAVLTQSRDIADRKYAEQALLASEEKFRELADNSIDVIWNMDKRLHFIYLSPSCVELLGRQPEEMIGKPLWDFVKWKDFSPMAKNAIRTLKNFSNNKKQRFVLEGNMQHKNGSAIPVEVIGKPLVDKAGNMIGLQGSTRDVTERKRAEEEIRTLNHDLEQRVKRRTAELQAANKDLESFAYSVSHDLRSPLRHIIGFANILQRDLKNDAAQPDYYFDKISRAGERMQQMIDDLLVFSRIGRGKISKEKVSFNRMVKTIIAEYEQETIGREILWKVEKLPTVKGDANLLKSVLSNLISNAIKFSDQEKSAIIEIGSRLANGNIEFYIKDNGVGFDPNYVHKLFNVFQRLHTEDEFPGTGIGLANVKRIIERHGGSVRAEGSIGHGATFYFSLLK
jgi:PAS domain S-box-containing protein